MKDEFNQALVRPTVRLNFPNVGFGCPPHRLFCGLLLRKMGTFLFIKFIHEAEMNKKNRNVPIFTKALSFDWLTGCADMIY
jgi:hypothetical protein